MTDDTDASEIFSLASRPQRASTALAARRFFAGFGINPDLLPDIIRLATGDAHVPTGASAAIVVPGWLKHELAGVLKIPIDGHGTEVPGAPPTVAGSPNAMLEIQVPRDCKVAGPVVLVEGTIEGLTIAEAGDFEVWAALRRMGTPDIPAAREAVVIPTVTPDPARTVCNELINAGVPTYWARDTAPAGFERRRDPKLSPRYKDDGAAELVTTARPAKDDLTPPFESITANTLSSANDKLSTQFHDFCYCSTNGSKRNITCQATPGAGKTYAFLNQMIQTILSDPDKQFVILAPEHNLTEQTLNDVKKVSGSNVSAEIWYGADQLCHNKGLLDAVREAGGTTENACAVCPLQTDCDYQKQFDKQAQIWIGAHALLDKVPPAPIKHERHVATAIDESFFKSLLTGVGRLEDAPQLPLDTLFDQRVALEDRTEFETQELNGYVSLLSNAVDQSQRWITRDVVHAAGLASEVCQRAADLEDKAIPDFPDLPYNPQPSTVRARTYDFALQLRREQFRARVWRLLAQWLATEEDTCPYLEVASVGTNAGLPCRAIVARWTKPVHPRWRMTSIISLDATGDRKIFDTFFGYSESIDVALPMSTSTQLNFVPDRSTTRRRLVGDGSADDAKNADAFARMLEKQCDPNATRLIAQKDVVQKLQQRCGNFVADTAHFNALRGRNDLESANHLVVLGRPLPPAQVVARMASVLTGRWVDPDQAYQWQSVPVWGANRRCLGTTERRVHPDPEAERVRYQLVDAELKQAIHRARPVRRDDTTPVTIDVIVSDARPNLPYTEIRTFDNRDRLNHWAERAATLGVVPRTWAALHAVTRTHSTWTSFKKYWQRQEREAGTSPRYDSHGAVSRPHAKMRTSVRLLIPNLRYRRVQLSVPAIARTRFEAFVAPEMSEDDVEQVFNKMRPEGTSFMNVQIEEEYGRAAVRCIRSLSSKTEKYDIDEPPKSNHFRQAAN